MTSCAPQNERASLPSPSRVPGCAVCALHLSHCQRLREKSADIATELAEMHPDVILVGGTAVVGVVRPLLRSIPVVFVQVTDPVGTGLIESLAHPGGNMTGFTSFEYSFGGKWLELLKDLQPAMTRVAVVQHVDNANRIGYLRAIETAASVLNVNVVAPEVRQVTELEGAFASFVHEPGIGLS